MPTLEDKLRAGQRVITAELPAIDGGGLAEVRRQLAPMRDWLDAVNVDRQHRPPTRTPRRSRSPSR